MSLSTQKATSERYAEANAPLTALLDTVPADRWDRPSPCEEWVARDVVRHLIQTQRDFLTGRGFAFGGDVDADVDADPASAWRTHARAVGDLLARPEVAATEYDGYFGPTTVGHTVGQFYIPDMVVHRWDIASAVDADPTLTDDELDRTEASIDSWGEAMYTAGICKPAVVPPAGASRQTVLLARMGRRAW
ncbi:MAG TPA: maleylpyruvate isomerase family mycothiol-dependent enzyme [Nakamurella sp.]